MGVLGDPDALFPTASGDVFVLFGGEAAAAALPAAVGGRLVILSSRSNCTTRRYA